MGKSMFSEEMTLAISTTAIAGLVLGLVILVIAGVMFAKWRWFNFLFSFVRTRAEDHRSFVYVNATLFALLGLLILFFAVSGRLAQ